MRDKLRKKLIISTEKELFSINITLKTISTRQKALAATLKHLKSGLKKKVPAVPDKEKDHTVELSDDQLDEIDKINKSNLNKKLKEKLISEISFGHELI